MQRIYCISGMGADERAFSKLSVPGFELVPVKWTAYDKNDTLATYAQKLTSQITEHKPVLLGLSLGGMLSVEVGKIIPTRKIILVSSAKTTSELPGMGQKPFLKNLVKMLPTGFFGHARLMNTKMIGAENDEDRKLLIDMMRDTDPGFIKWSLGAVVGWSNNTYPKEVFHVHGTADRIIPSKKVRPDVWVQGGSHIMIYNRADEVNRIISGCLSTG